MNFILCSEQCKHQNEGYCTLEGAVEISNAVTSSCCYFENKSALEKENNKDKYRQFFEKGSN